ncbi:lysozyme, partial [Deinococcus sp.]|uniref:lysozyme n=1 Tax=Deinococcus sp. TaxID=47478 RepID=UPI00286E8C3C
SGYNTIGYGHLLDKNLDGETDQREWQTYGKTGFPRALTSAQQEELLTQDLKPYEDAISQAIQVPITQEMFDAFIIFSFNTGNPGSFAGTNVLEVLNKGLYDQLPGAMYKWIYSNKRQVKGLKNRRLKEITMFARPYQNGRKP